MPDLPSILNFKPTYVVAGGRGGTRVLAAVLNDFMLPEEFVSAAAGALRRRGRSLSTMSDLADCLQQLGKEDRLSLEQAGVLCVSVSAAAPTDAGDRARVWGAGELLDNAMAGPQAAAYDVPQQFGGVSAPIIDRPPRP